MGKEIRIRETIQLPHEGRRLHYYDKDFVIIEGDIPLHISCVDIPAASVRWVQKVGYFRLKGYEDGVLYFGMEKSPGSHYYAALDVATGEYKWDAHVSNSYKCWHGAGPYFYEDSVIIIAGDALWSFDKATGKKKFKTKLMDYNETVTPLLWNGKIVVQGYKRKANFYVYNPQTGELENTVPVKKGMDYYHSGRPSRVLVDDTCYYMSNDLVIRSVNFKTGKQQEYKLPRPGTPVTWEISYYLEEDGHILRLRLDHAFKKTVDGEEWWVDTFAIGLDTKKRVLVDEKFTERPIVYDKPSTEAKDVKLEDEEEDLSVVVDDCVIQMPSYGKHSRIRSTVSPSETMKVVLQDSGEDSSVVHIVEVTS